MKNSMINATLQSIQYLQMWVPVRTMSIHASLPAESKAGTIDTIASDPWEGWNRIKNLCESHKRLGVALELTSRLPSDVRLQRWFGEPVRAIFINTNVFLFNTRGQPVLPKRHQQFLYKMFQFKVHIVINGFSKFLDGLVPYQYYIRHLFMNRPARTHQEVTPIPQP